MLKKKTLTDRTTKHFNVTQFILTVPVWWYDIRRGTRQNGRSIEIIPAGSRLRYGICFIEVK